VAFTPIIGLGALLVTIGLLVIRRAAVRLSARPPVPTLKRK
jgi:hypothetical protein